MSSGTRRMFDCLPDEVLAENIFSRLPVKSILQCMCVCKSWRSLITSRNFISTHRLLHHSKDPRKIFVYQHSIETNRNCKLFLFNNQDEDYFLPKSLHLPPGLDNGTTTRFKILGSVNGLICISVCEGSFYHIVTLILFNPSIGRFLSIPPPPYSSPEPSPPYPWLVQAFGFDETTQDYKILLIQAGNAAFVYSLNSNCWRSLPISPPHFDSRSEVFVNGGIHWIHCPPPLFKNCIIVFDVKMETFRQVPLPECLVEAHSLSLMEFGEDSSSLALAVPTYSEGVTHIWVMKEYGLVESWFKLATLDSSSVVLGFRNNEQVLIRFRKRYRVRKNGCILSQSIHNKSEEIKNLIDVDEGHGYLLGHVYKYVPSLVLLDKQSNVDATFVHATPNHVQEEGEQQLELRRSKRLRKAPA